jgi:hypothetical protein
MGGDGPPRPGARGGRAEFNWQSVKEDAQRDFYLGHSVKASVGRWQKGGRAWEGRGGVEGRRGAAAAHSRPPRPPTASILRKRPLLVHESRRRGRGRRAVDAGRSGGGARRRGGGDGRRPRPTAAGAFNDGADAGGVAGAGSAVQKGPQREEKGTKGEQAPREVALARQAAPGTEPVPEQGRRGGKGAADAVEVEVARVNARRAAPRRPPPSRGRPQPGVPGRLPTLLLPAHRPRIITMQPPLTPHTAAPPALRRGRRPGTFPGAAQSAPRPPAARTARTRRRPRPAP